MFKRLLQTCAASVLLGVPAFAADAPVAPAPIKEPAMQQPSRPPPLPQQPAPTVQVQIQQGRYFRWAIPSGWQFNETNSGVDLKAPDGLTTVSHALTRGPGQMNPDQALQMVLQFAPQLGLTNVQIRSRQAMPPEGNLQSVMYVLNYDLYGTPVHSISVYTVENRWGEYYLDVMSVQGPPQTFGRDLGVLMQLGHSVCVTNPAEVCGNDRLLRYTPPPVAPVAGSGSLNPVGDMIVKGEQERNRIRDNDHLHNVDVTRGVTRWGPNGDIATPNEAARTFVTPGGTPIYNVHTNTPPPPNSTEVDPYKYNK